MKTLVLVLTLAFSGSQMVAFVDCCCGSFCSHKNSCEGCGKEKECLEHSHGAGSKVEAKRSCCKKELALGAREVKKEEGKKRVCSHLEPSYEVANQSPQALPSPESLGILALIDLGLGHAEEHPIREGHLTEIIPRSPPDLPLHLLLSVLRI